VGVVVGSAVGEKVGEAGDMSGIDLKEFVVKVKGAAETEEIE
jgi:hypothetical protein